MSLYIHMYMYALTLGHTWRELAHTCVHACVTHPYDTVGYIRLLSRTFLSSFFFISSLSLSLLPFSYRPRFLQLRPFAFFLYRAIPSLLQRAFSLVSSRPPLPSLLSLSLSLTISDLIRFVVQCCSRCDYMPEVPCSLGAMPELRRRVSLQSTTLLRRRLSRMIGASNNVE